MCIACIAIVLTLMTWRQVVDWSRDITSEKFATHPQRAGYLAGSGV